METLSAEPEVINVGDFEERKPPLIVESSKAVAVNNPFQLIAMALEKDVDVERLSKLMDLQTQWEDREARKSFARSFSECQSQIPRVIKNKENKQTKSWYTDLSSVNSAIMPVATSHGFSISFSEAGEMVDGQQIPKKPDDIRTIMIVRHKDGHSETHFYDLPMDNTGMRGEVNKTVVHGKASATSYAERYLFCQVFSITIDGQDNDGNVKSRTLNEEEINTIRDKYADCRNAKKPVNEGKLLTYVSELQKELVQTLGQVDVKFFPVIIKQLDKQLRVAIKENQEEEDRK